MTATPWIKTERLELAPVRVEDAAEMADVFSDPGLHAFTGGGPPTLEELGVRLSRWADGSPRPDEEWHNWVVRLGHGTAIGHVQATVTRSVRPDASAADRAADIAWLIGTPWQGQGYASEAARALVVWLAENGVRTITAHIAARHGASERVAAAAGLAPTDTIEDGEVVWCRVIRPITPVS